MSSLRSSLVRLAAKNPDLRPHLLPLLSNASRQAGFFDFLKRKPLKTKVKSGLLVSLLQPDNDNGPIQKVLRLALLKFKSLLDVKILDYESQNGGDTLIVDFATVEEEPDLRYTDADIYGVNYAQSFDKLLKPAILELQDILGVKVSGMVLPVERESPTFTRYQIRVELPPGTSRTMDLGMSPFAPPPSAARVASRYLARR